MVTSDSSPCHLETLASKEQPYASEDSFSDGSKTIRPPLLTAIKQSEDVEAGLSIIPSDISSKRNIAFHGLFPSVPTNDYLIQEYGCSFQRECAIGGRLYLTENHICFYSNIYRWNSNFIIPFHEVTSLERNTTTHIPNAIQVYTYATSYTFTSLLLRDTVYELMQNIWRLAYPELGSVANEGADSQANRIIGLKQTNYFDQSTDVASAVGLDLLGLPTGKGGKASVSQLSEGQTILAKPLEMTLDNGCSSLVPIDSSTDSAKSNICSVSQGPLGPATTEVASHAPARSPYLTEISSNLQSNSPKLMASAVYECLIQHGCLDLMSSVDPLGFSTCAVAEGGFGDVWTGRFLKDGVKIGIKVLRFTLSTGDVARKELKRTAREIYNWSKLDHENVNKLIGVIMFRERLGMVSEWMEHGNLRQYLGRNNGVDRGELCIQIARGVAYLHGVNMVHGDLKACNILVSSTGVIKITDFDYSIFPECSLVFSATSRVGGTLRWMAPELVLEEKPPQRNSKTDIYALGMTFLETITDAEPYLECEREFQIYRRLACEEHPERSDKHFPDTEWGNMIWNLLLRCWNFNPMLRPTSQDVLESLLAL